MSYTNQSSTDAIRSNIRGKSGGQYGSDIGDTDGRQTGNTTNTTTAAAERAHGGSDQLSDPSYSTNGDPFSDDRRQPERERQGTEYDRVRAGDPDQVSDPTYSQNADRFDNAASSGGGRATGDPTTTTARSGDAYGSSGNTYGSGNEYGSSNDTYGSGGYREGNDDDDDDADVGGYGKSGTYRQDSDAADLSGGQGPTGYAQQRSDVRAGDNAYGNISSDAGGQVIPPGGANDPAYQPGRRYSNSQGGVVGEDSGNNNNAGGKVGMGDKIKGALEKVQGKITKNPDLVQQGEARKTGNLNNGDSLSSGNAYNDNNQHGSTGNTDTYGTAGRNQFDTTSGNQYGQSGNNDY